MFRYRLRHALRTASALVLATILSFGVVVFVDHHQVHAAFEPRQLSDSESIQREVMADALWYDRKGFDPSISLQDWANLSYNYILNGGQTESLTTFDKVFGDHAVQLLSDFLPQWGLPPAYIAQCESGYITGASRAENFDAVHNKKNPKYRGKYQIGFPEWTESQGLVPSLYSDPSDASEEEQNFRASFLWQNGRGRSRWQC